MNDFENLLCQYIDHGSPEGIDAWTQTDLMRLINMAEAELTRRHALVYDTQPDPVAVIERLGFGDQPEAEHG